MSRTAETLKNGKPLVMILIPAPLWQQLEREKLPTIVNQSPHQRLRGNMHPTIGTEKSTSVLILTLWTQTRPLRTPSTLWFLIRAIAILVAEAAPMIIRRREKFRLLC